MSGQAPQSGQSKTPGGVLPISAVNNQQHSGADNKAHAKNPPQKLKVVIRRLPPGLTPTEFEDAIGDEWKIGQGKVSWAMYRPGKVSKDLSKPSRPSRAYFQVTRHSHVETFAEKIQQTTFLDARNTANDTSLYGPPVLEYAPYSRVASSKRRHDARQGLVDQDPDFIFFLQSLTNPTQRPAPIDSVEGGIPKDESVKVTPLIQHLRDKKAAKEAAKEKEKEKEKEKPATKPIKHGRQSSKIDTTDGPPSKPATQNSKSTTDVPEKKSGRATRTEKITKQTTKQAKKEPLRKEQPTLETKSLHSSSPAAAAPATSEVSKTTEAAPKRSEKPSAAAVAARMIQRDLGIRGRGGSPRARSSRQTAETTQEVSSPVETPQANGKSPTTPTVKPSQPEVAAEPAPKPAILKREPAEKSESNQAASKASSKASPSSNQQSRPTPAASTSNAATTNKQSTPAPPPKPKPEKKPPMITQNATQAFLKHANASQGINEALIQTALSEFGQVSKVEIDKRKGFAYVDFADSESLQKAINASPVKVAQGSVQVLERKDRPAVAARGGSAQARGGAAPSATASTTTPSAPPTNSRNGGSNMTQRGTRGRGRGGANRGDANSAVSSTSKANPATPTAGTSTAVDAIQDTAEPPSAEPTAPAEGAMNAAPAQTEPVQTAATADPPTFNSPTVAPGTKEAAAAPETSIEAS